MIFEEFILGEAGYPAGHFIHKREASIHIGGKDDGAGFVNNVFVFFLIDDGLFFRCFPSLDMGVQPGEQEVKYQEGKDRETKGKKVLFGIRVLHFANLYRKQFLLQRVYRCKTGVNRFVEGFIFLL